MSEKRPKTFDEARQECGRELRGLRDEILAALEPILAPIVRAITRLLRR